MEVLRPLLIQNLAPGSGPVVAQRIEELLLARGFTTIGGIGLLSFVLVVYGIFSAIENTFNTIWGSTTPANALNRLPTYLGLLIIIPILVVSSLALSAYLKALPLVHQAVERVGFMESLINQILPGLMVMVGFFLLYRFLPNVRVRTYAAVVGALVAGLLYEAVKFGFISYSRVLVQYDVIYGSLAFIPLLMIWVDLSWIVVLLGVEVCFVTQHYNMLLDKRKHVLFSRPQTDALAYLILTHVTLAFRGGRGTVTLDEWSHKYRIPPGNVRGIVERLKWGGILETTGKGNSDILLTRDPNYIKISDIDQILSGETLEEWKWPQEVSWLWLKEWMKRRNNVVGDRMDGITLGELVAKIDAA